MSAEMPVFLAKKTVNDGSLEKLSYHQIAMIMESLSAAEGDSSAVAALATIKSFVSTSSLITNDAINGTIDVDDYADIKNILKIGDYTFQGLSMEAVLDSKLVYRFKGLAEKYEDPENDPNNKDHLDFMKGLSFKELHDFGVLGKIVNAKLTEETRLSSYSAVHSVNKAVVAKLEQISEQGLGIVSQDYIMVEDMIRNMPILPNGSGLRGIDELKNILELARGRYERTSLDDVVPVDDTFTEETSLDDVVPVDDTFSEETSLDDFVPVDNTFSDASADEVSITLEQANAFADSYDSLYDLDIKSMAEVIRSLSDAESKGDLEAEVNLSRIETFLLSGKMLDDISQGKIEPNEYNSAILISGDHSINMNDERVVRIADILDGKMVERLNAIVKSNQPMNDMSFSELAELGWLTSSPIKDLSGVELNDDFHEFTDNHYRAVEAKFDQLRGGMISLNPQDFEAVKDLFKIYRFPDDSKQEINNILEKSIQDYDNENDLAKADEKILQKNSSSLNAILDAIDIENSEVKNGILQDVFRVLDRVDITNDDGEIVDDVKRQQHIANMFEAAKLDVIQANLGNGKFLMNNLRDKTDSALIGLKDNMFLLLASCGVASTFRAPTEAELVEGSDEQKKYQEESALASENQLDNLINGSERFSVSESIIIAGCVEKEVDFNNFQSRVGSILPYSRVHSKLKGRLRKVSNMFENAWGNRYKIMKNIINSIKDNKQMHISNTLATLAVSGAVATGFGAIAIGSYAVYTAASSAVWPVLAEANKMRRMAKEKGEKVSFLQSLKSAWKTVKSQKSYKTKIVTSCIAGGIGAAVGFGGLNMGLETFMQKAVASLARSAGSVAAQTVGVVDARREYKKNPTDENKAKLKSATTSLAIGGTVAIIGSALSVANAASHKPILDSDSSEQVTDSTKVEIPVNATDSTKVEIPVNATDSTKVEIPVNATDSTKVEIPVNATDSTKVETPVNATDSTKVEIPVNATDSTKVEIPEKSVAGATAIPTNSEFNGEIPNYNKNMGISARQFQTILNTRSEEEVSRMYTNLNDDVMKKYFPNMTREQALYKYNRLDAWTARVKEVPSVDANGKAYMKLVPLLGKDGNPVPRYQMDEEMKALKKLLECGEVGDEKKLLNAVSEMKAHIKLDGDTDLSGPRTANVITKLDNEGCPEDNHAYGYGPAGEKVKAVAETTTPKATPTPDPVPETTVPEDNKVPVAVVDVPAAVVDVPAAAHTYLRLPAQYGDEIAIKGGFDDKGVPVLSGNRELDAKTVWLSSADSKGQVEITRWNPVVQKDNGFIHTKADYIKAKDIGIIIGAADKDGVLDGKIKLGLQSYTDSTDLDVKKASLNGAVPSTMAGDLTDAGRVGVDGSKKTVKEFFMKLMNNSKSK